MRDASIHLRVLPEQRDLIDQAATVLGKKRTDFMLESVCEKAQSVLLDQTFFRLDNSHYNEFMSMLDAPQENNVGLSRLMEITAPWKKSQ